MDEAQVGCISQDSKTAASSLAAFAYSKLLAIADLRERFPIRALPNVCRRARLCSGDRQDQPMHLLRTRMNPGL